VRHWHERFLPHREVLVEFEQPVFALDRTGYSAQVCDGSAGDGTQHWHGWIEFTLLEGGPVISNQ